MLQRHQLNLHQQLKNQLIFIVLINLINQNQNQIQIQNQVKKIKKKRNKNNQIINSKSNELESQKDIQSTTHQTEIELVFDSNMPITPVMTPNTSIVYEDNNNLHVQSVDDNDDINDDELTHEHYDIEYSTNL